MTRSLPVIQPSSLIPEGRKPAWLKVRAPGGPNYMRLKSRMREWNLHSVCEEARCPNIGECWEDATATFMILGDVCTRNCGYCAIAHGTPVWEDREEPERIGRAVRELGLEYVVITSVNRDDLADGGAAHWAATVRAVRRHAPRCRVEVLIPDFQGGAASLETVLDARPDILNHNTETVERLYKAARHGGRYARALGLFRHARAVAPEIPTKSGIILGLGEERAGERRRVAPRRGPPTDGAGLADPSTVTYAPLLMTFAFAALVAGALLGIPKLLAPRRLTPVKAEPFECGKDPIAVAEGRFAIKFSTIAIFFILIDIELMFVWPWAVIYRRLGWFGFAEMMVFLGILMLGFLYIWRKGGLEWD